MQLSHCINKTRLSLSRIINMIGGSTLPVFEEYFKKYDVQKWEQAKEAKPSIETGMTEEMSGLYDKIVQVSKKKKCLYLQIIV